MAPKPHSRTPSHGRRTLLHAKPPPFSRRGHSSNTLHTLSSYNSMGKSMLGGPKEAFTEILSGMDEEELGTASFLQFCATCEKQIVSPGSNILYCSEACREKDAAGLQVLDSHLISLSTSTPPSHRRSSYFDAHHHPNILPQRSPTVLRPISMTFSNATTPESEQPLSSSSSSDEEGEEEEEDHDTFFPHHHHQHRPPTTRASTAETLPLPPSLSHTPSSSVGTAASGQSYRYTTAPTRQDVLVSLQQQYDSYHYNYRRQHQQRTGSVDLVTPCVGSSSRRKGSEG